MFSSKSLSITLCWLKRHSCVGRESYSGFSFKFVVRIKNLWVSWEVALYVFVFMRSFNRYFPPCLEETWAGPVHKSVQLMEPHSLFHWDLAQSYASPERLILQHLLKSWALTLHCLMDRFLCRCLESHVSVLRIASWQATLLCSM